MSATWSVYPIKYMNLLHKKLKHTTPLILYSDNGVFIFADTNLVVLVQVYDFQRLCILWFLTDNLSVTTGLSTRGCLCYNWNTQKRKQGGAHMIMTQGTLINKRNNREEAYSMSMLKTSELDQVMHLQDAVYNALPNKQVLAKDTQQFIETCLHDDGFVIGVHNEANQLISYRFIALPKNRDDNMGLDIKLPSAELTKVAHLETTIVHPDYRGNGLQSKTLKIAFPMLHSQHIKHVICTVSPFNFFSLANIMKNGLKIKVLTKKYGSLEDNSDGLWRFILHKDIEVVSHLPHLNDVKVKLESFKEQTLLLKKGFIGDAITADGKFLSYVK